MDFMDWKETPLYRDLVFLLVLVIISYLCSLWFGRSVLATAWDSRGLLRSGYSIGTGIFGSAQLLQSAILGGMVGLLLAWLLDTYKQLQIPIPFVIFSTLLATSGFSFGAIATQSIVQTTSTALLFGGIVLYVCGIKLTRLFSSKHVLGTEPREYRYVPWIAFLSVAAIVVGGLVDTHYVSFVAGSGVSDRFFLDLVSAAGLIVILGWLITYDNQVRVIQLGPGKAGKTSVIGGLYSDIKSANDTENVESREVTSNRLDSISQSIETEHEFPDWTGNRDELYFSYFDRERIFRTKNTVATLDYRGEDFVGKKDDPGFAAMLENHKESVDNLSTLQSLTTSIRDLLRGNDVHDWINKGQEQLDEQVGRLLYTADVVLITVPLDDFLEVPIKHGGAPPEYADIVLIERIDDNRFRVEYSDPEKDPVQIRKATADEAGDYYRCEDDSQFTEFSFDYESLPIISEKKRYCVTKERQPREEYINEYRKILKYFDTFDLNIGRDIIWVVTMTDLHDSKDSAKNIDDNIFEDVYNDVGKSIRTGETNPTQQYLVDEGWFDGNPTPATDELDYKLLSTWIKSEYLSNSMDVFEDLINKSDEQFVYPVWYNIDGRSPTGELLIRSDGGQILNCSDYLIDRLEGRSLDEGLVTSHPNASLPQLLANQLSPIRRIPVSSSVELAYSEMERQFNK